MEADEKAIWIARRLLGFIALRELLMSAPLLARRTVIQDGAPGGAAEIAGVYVACPTWNSPCIARSTAGRISGWLQWYRCAQEVPRRTATYTRQSRPRRLVRVLNNSAAGRITGPQQFRRAIKRSNRLLSRLPFRQLIDNGSYGNSLLSTQNPTPYGCNVCKISM